MQSCSVEIVDENISKIKKAIQILKVQIIRSNAQTTKNN